MKPVVKVVGLGPSGSAFLKTYSRAVGVELSRQYFKACGEAVPVETPLVDPEFVVDKVRRFKFYLWRKEVGEVTYLKPRWYIVNKKAWVESMRDENLAGETPEVLVKAGGPYQSVGEKIYVARAYIEGIKLEDETAYFIFPQDSIGFYWVFPHGGVYNIGAGFIGVSNPVPYIYEFIERWLGGGRVIDMRAAPLTIVPQITLYDGESFRIGEAAGLIYPLTGEGIRPGIISAIELAKALGTRHPLRNYRRAVWRIIRQVEFQKRILRLAQRLLAKGRTPIEFIEDSILREYIEENLGAKTLFIALAKRPRQGIRLINALLR